MMMRNFKNNSFLWNTIGNLFVSFLSMLFMIIVIRVHGVSFGGIFNYGFTIAFIFYSIAQYGGRTFHVSDNNTVLTESDFIASRIFTTIVSFIIFIIYICICSYQFDKSIIMILLCIYKLIEALCDVLHGYYQKENKLYLAGKSMFFRSLASLTIFFLSEKILKSLIISCIFLIVNNLIFLLIDLYQSRKISKWNYHFDIKKTKYYLKNAFFVFSFTFFLLFSFNIPRYFIDGLLNDELQAIYGIVIMPASLISLMGHLIMQPSVLKITELYRKRQFKKINKILFKTIIVAALLSVVLIVGTMLFGIPVLELIFKVNLNNQLINIILVIIGSLFYLVSIFLSTILIIMRKTGFQLFIYLSSSIVGLVFAYYLINTFQLNGGIFCYVLLMFIQMTLYVVYYIFEIRKGEKLIEKNT